MLFKLYHLVFEIIQRTAASKVDCSRMWFIMLNWHILLDSMIPWHRQHCFETHVFSGIWTPANAMFLRQMACVVVNSKVSKRALQIGITITNNCIPGVTIRDFVGLVTGSLIWRNYVAFYWYLTFFTSILPIKLCSNPVFCGSKSD